MKLESFTYRGNLFDNSYFVICIRHLCVGGLSEGKWGCGFWSLWQTHQTQLQHSVHSSPELRVPWDTLHRCTLWVTFALCGFIRVSELPACFVVPPFPCWTAGQWPRTRLGDALWASCQNVLQERNLTHSYHCRPIYLGNQWAFKNSPAHISCSVMVSRCFVLWFCGLLREPCFSANDDISIGKRKLTAFTLPLEKKWEIIMRVTNAQNVQRKLKKKK